MAAIGRLMTCDLSGHQEQQEVILTEEILEKPLI